MHSQDQQQNPDEPLPELDIEQLELSLGMFEIELDEKLKEIKNKFAEPDFILDFTKLYYDHVSSSETKFKELMLDLQDFLIKEELAATPTLRNTFFRILENPLFSLFKTPKFQLLQLSFKGFDVELEPIEAIRDVYKKLLKSAKTYTQLKQQKHSLPQNEKQFRSYEELVLLGARRDIEYKIFMLYNYIRKGVQLLKKTYETRLEICEMFTPLQKLLMPQFVQQKHIRGIKELSALNFEIFTLEPSYDYFIFYFLVPLQKEYIPVFEEISQVADKCFATKNYNPFLLFFIKHHRELNELFLRVTTPDPEFLLFISNLLNGALTMLRANVLMYEELIKTMSILLGYSRTLSGVLQNFLKYKPTQEKDALIAIKSNYNNFIVKENEALLLTLKPVTFEKAKESLQKIQEQCFFALDFDTLQISKISQICEIMGGVFGPYLGYLEAQLKQWNSTMSTSNKLKYIESQFSVPTENQESGIKCINNFLSLSKVYPSEFGNLLETRVNWRYFLDLLVFLEKKSNQLKDLSNSETLGKFVSHTYRLFNLSSKSKQGPTKEQRVKYLEAFSQAPQLFKHSAGFSSTLITNLDPTQLFIQDYLRLLLNMSSTVDPSLVVSRLLVELDSVNQKIDIWKYHEARLAQVSQDSITATSAALVRQNFEEAEGYLYAKNPKSIFRVSGQDTTTNPLSLESKIDDYFLTLTANTKRVIQVIILLFVKELEVSLKYNSRLNLLKSLLNTIVNLYPVTVVYLGSLKVSTKDLKNSLNQKQGDNKIVASIPDSCTVGELLCYVNLLTDGQVSCLIQELLSHHEVRFLNGTSFARQELATTISQTCISIINIIRSGERTYQLSTTLSVIVTTFSIQQTFSREQAELLRNTLEIVKEELTTNKDIEQLLSLSRTYNNLVRLFFRLKEQELRPGLESVYSSCRYQSIRNYSSVGSSSQQKIDFKKVDKLKPQAHLTFSIKMDFDVETSVLNNLPAQSSKRQDIKNIQIASIAKELPKNKNRTAGSKMSSSSTGQQVSAQKQIDISGCKYSLINHLGEGKMDAIARKTGSLLRLNSETVYPKVGHFAQAQEQEEVRNIVLFYVKQLGFPIWQAAQMEAALVKVLQGNQHTQFLLNEHNYAKALSFLLLALISDKFEGQGQGVEYLKSIEGDQTRKQQLTDRILDIICDFGYSNVWVHSFKDLTAQNLASTTSLLKCNPDISQDEALLTVFLKHVLNRHSSNQLQSSERVSRFLYLFFAQRPEGNMTLTYKVIIDKPLLNLMLKCIDFHGLDQTSILFYCNFENLRLYTEDIQEGFKALGLASKTRSYNEFLKLSNQHNDPEFLTPLKLFKDNLRFFIKVEREGYDFKKQEEAAIAADKIAELLRKVGQDSSSVCHEIDKIIESYNAQVHQLKVNTINRVKSIYLAARLRDLAIQNGTTISLLSEVLTQLNTPQQKHIEEIERVELLSVLSSLHFGLLHFQNSFSNLNNYAHYYNTDRTTLEENILFSTTRRFAFMLDKTHLSLDFDFDDLLQVALINAKSFLITPLGNSWAARVLSTNPALMTFNRVNFEEPRKTLTSRIMKVLSIVGVSGPKNLELKKSSLLQDLRKQILPLPGQYFLRKQNINYRLDGAESNLAMVTESLVAELINRQILTKSENFLYFNRYKFSEDSLEALQILGRLVAGCFAQEQRLDLALSPSIVSQVSGSMVEFDDLIGVDFKTWEYLKSVLVDQDSKSLNLNFSYQFQKDERVELVEKGASKKVNNLNREEYCDLICCRILFGNTKLQLTRFLLGLYRVLPRQYLANLLPAQLHNTFYSNLPGVVKKLQQQSLAKFGVVLPETYNHNGVTFQNLKDYMNISWLTEAIALLPHQKLVSLSNKLGFNDPAFLNLRVYTRTGPSESLQLIDGAIVINHFGSREKLEQQLAAKL